MGFGGVYTTHTLDPAVQAVKYPDTHRRGIAGVGACGIYAEVFYALLKRRRSCPPRLRRICSRPVRHVKARRNCHRHISTGARKARRCAAVAANYGDNLLLLAAGTSCPATVSLQAIWTSDARRGKGKGGR